jgi:hypothetical protein
MKHEISIIYFKNENYIMLRCPEGCKITSWNENDDIKEFNAFDIAYCPKDTDTSIYHCISEEDYRILSEKHIEAIKQ